MSLANPLWGAPRIHGELLKLGIDVGQTSVAKYMARRRRPPSQGWRTFLLNHADGIASIDLFVVPMRTLAFRVVVATVMFAGPTSMRWARGGKRRDYRAAGIATLHFESVWPDVIVGLGIAVMRVRSFWLDTVTTRVA